MNLGDVTRNIIKISTECSGDDRFIKIHRVLKEVKSESIKLYNNNIIYGEGKKSN